jgi:hypothetical protein
VGPALTQLKALMPAMFAHEGTWIGHYRHLSESGELLDEHDSRVECTLPDETDIIFRQTNLFTWADGRKLDYGFEGALRNDQLWFDTATFVGGGWQTRAGIITLNLDRKDLPGHKFIEVIVMGDNQNHRVRTWYYFENGICYKRTLCTEQRVT